MHPLLCKNGIFLGKYHPMDDTPVPFTLEGWQPHGSGQVRALDSCMPKCWARHNLGHINHPVCCDWSLWLVDARQWEFGNGRLLSAVEFPGKISDRIFFFLMRRQLSTLEACCMNDLACIVAQVVLSHHTAHKNVHVDACVSNCMCVQTYMCTIYTCRMGPWWTGCTSGRYDFGHHGIITKSSSSQNPCQNCLWDQNWPRVIIVHRPIWMSVGW